MDINLEGPTRWEAPDYDEAVALPATSYSIERDDVYGLYLVLYAGPNVQIERMIDQGLLDAINNAVGQQRTHQARRAVLGLLAGACIVGLFYLSLLVFGGSG